MSINVNWKEKRQFTVVTSGGFTLDIDSESKSAPCPTEILLSALGSCSATDVALYFEDNNLELKKLTNELTYELTDTEPRLYKSVNLHFSIEATNVSEHQVETAIKDAITKYCHVCLMLKPAMTITHSLDLN
jgi:putative redox protein